MSLRDDMRSDLHDSFLDPDGFAEEMVYQPETGSAKTIGYTPLSSVDDEVEETDGVWRIRKMNVLISADATLGIIKPNVVDAVTIATEAWAITEFISDTICSHTLMLERRELIKKIRR